jgi:hypothetical protein
MSNIATTLTSWAKELHLEDPRGTKGGRVAHLSSKSEEVKSDAVCAMGFDKTCRFCNINGHAVDDCQLFINFLMASRFAKQNADLVTSTLNKHNTFMRLKHRGRAPHVNNIDTMTSSDVPVTDGVTLDGGQIVQFDDGGLVNHLQDDSTLYDYEGSDNESVHVDPFTIS